MSAFLDELLTERGCLLADGAMGTSLFALGLETGDCPELWNLEHPERVRSVHRDYLEAGSDIILTNSFGGTRFRLDLHAFGERCGVLNEAAASVARAEADSYMAETGRRVLVAGSVGPTGELMQPLGMLTEETAKAAFREQVEALARGGADLIWIETMSAPEEARAAIEAAGATSLPIVCTMTFDTNRRTMMGYRPEDLPNIGEGLAVTPSAVGANCGIGPSELLDSVLEIASASDPRTIVVAKGNCGVPRYVDGHIRYDGSPAIMADYARLARDAGARIIGGCCGSTAEHVRAMAEALKSHPLGEEPSREVIADALGKPWNSGVPGELSLEADDGVRRRRRRARARPG